MNYYKSDWGLISNVNELREAYVNKSGSTGEWNVTLEDWVKRGSIALTIIQPQNYLKEKLKKISALVCGKHKTITSNTGEFGIVYTTWDMLVKIVRQAALKESLLVMISGNLSPQAWDKAVRLAGGKNVIRRSLAGVSERSVYWNPTSYQLAINELRAKQMPLP